MNLKHTQEFMDRLPGGAFLTVKDGDTLNTMTIGWGSLGIMWLKPTLMVPVRFSRHTYALLENAQTFTVTVPLDDQMKQALAFAGSRSGREVDKFEALGLTILPGRTVETPVIVGHALHYECRIVHVQTLEPRLLESGIREKIYPGHNYHVLFYGEVLAEYITD